MRKIIHIDMDAFFAAVEMRDNPKLQGKPVIIGSLQRRGVVSTCSYEARAFGVHSAMSCVKAQRLCPKAIFVDGGFDKYRGVSAQIMNIFAEFTSLVEPLSIDEAFLDVSHLGNESASYLARDIKAKIKKETGLTASAGVSYNKFLAKIASGIDKPDGLTVILPEEAEDFLSNLPIEKFFGIGKVLAKKMKNLGIYSGGDLRYWQMAELVRQFGKSGVFLYQVARGVDERPVVPAREQKSIGKETTFAHDLWMIDKMEFELKKLSLLVAEKLKAKGRTAKSVVLKLKYADFKVITRTRSFFAGIDDFELIFKTVVGLLRTHWQKGKPVRLLGVSVSGLNILQEKVYSQMLLPFF